MLNPERVDLIDENKNNSKVEIEFTEDCADTAMIIMLDESTAMNLAHMIMEQCSYAAKIKRGIYGNKFHHKYNKKLRTKF